MPLTYPAAHTQLTLRHQITVTTSESLLLHQLLTSSDVPHSLTQPTKHLLFSLSKQISILRIAHCRLHRKHRSVGNPKHQLARRNVAPGDQPSSASAIDSKFETARSA